MTGLCGSCNGLIGSSKGLCGDGGARKELADGGKGSEAVGKMDWEAVVVVVGVRWAIGGKGSLAVGGIDWKVGYLARMVVDCQSAEGRIGLAEVQAVVVAQQARR